MLYSLPNLSRRSVLSALGGYGVLLGAGNAAAGPTLPKDSHKQIAQVAQAGFGGRSHPLSVLYPQGAGANLRPVVQAFEGLTGIRVELIEVGIDMVDADLMLDAMLGEGRFDVALPATYALPDLIASGAILPLDVPAARYAQLAQQRQTLYDVGDHYSGQRYGFQTDGDSYLLFLNGDWLADPVLQNRYSDATGHPLAPPQTWEELDRQMAFFHDPEAQRFGGNLFRIPGYQTWEWWLRLHGKGIWPFASDMTAQVNAEPGVLALEEMIAASAWLDPSAYSQGVFGNADRFARGDVYCTLGWGGSQKRLNAPASAMRGRMVFSQPPGGLLNGQAQQAPYFNWGWSYVLSASSQCSDLGYLFSLFATTPAMSTLAVRQVKGFFDPFLPEHYEDVGIQRAYSKPFLREQRLGLQRAIPDLYLRGQTLYLQALGNNLDHALNGHATPQEALNHTAREWDLITTRIGRDEQAQSWAKLKQKYPPEFQSGLRDVAKAQSRAVSASH